VIVIAALPYVETNRALAAPAVLKAALLQHGIESVALDLNHDIYTMVSASQRQDLLRDALIYNNFSETVVSDFARLVKYAAEKILSKKPTVITLSLFCFQCRTFCYWLCAELRQHTNAPIVVGGPGIDSVVWLQEMKQNQLIDDFIMGDGEESFPAYIKGNKTFPGINTVTWTPVQDFQATPTPNYDDYDFFSYEEPSIPLIDSRGCVKSCEFCDVIERWKKFQYKTADQIFDEMMFQIEKHQIYHFDFRSSISNGNFREFMLLMNLIANYNQKQVFRSQQISWEGSYIVRESKNEQVFETLSRTNATLFMGVESVNEHTRKNLGKNFSNQALEWTLMQIEKYELDAKLLLIVDYPTETLEDYEATKRWFIKHKHYATILREVAFARAGIIPNTQLDKRSEEYGIVKKNEYIWINQRLGIDENLRYQLGEEVIELVERLGFRVERAL
jgi:radical SAM superfamily enzyme YgiQ (UPF0313 family)